MSEHFHDALTTYLKTKDPLTQLTHAIPLATFFHLSIPRYAIPKIHESLPSKPAFQDIPSLKRHYIDRSILALYKELDLNLERITLFTYVMADGYGDWGFQLSLAKEIQRLFPKTELHLVTLFHKEKKPIKSVEFPHDVFIYPTESISRKCIQKMAKSDLILQSPTYFKGWEEIESSLKGVQIEHLGEYGFIDSPDFHPQSSKRCLGIHFLEKGILIPEDLENGSFPKIENVYLAYLRSERGFVIFFAMLCILKGDVEVVIPKLEPLLSHIETLQSFAKSHGVAKLEFYTGEDICPIQLQSEGKTIKIFTKPHMTHPDFIDLMKKSPVVGCRGNQSLIEVLGYGKPFFYDAIKHNLPFLHDLTTLVRNYLPELVPLFSLFTASLNEDIEGWLSVGTKLGEIFSSSSLSQEIFSLFNLLKTEYPFNPILEGIVKRAAYIKQDPDHLKYEEEIISAIIEGKDTFETLYLSLKEKIDGSIHRNG